MKAAYKAIADLQPPLEYHQQSSSYMGIQHIVDASHHICPAPWSVQQQIKMANNADTQVLSGHSIKFHPVLLKMCFKYA